MRATAHIYVKESDWDALYSGHRNWLIVPMSSDIELNGEVFLHYGERFAQLMPTMSDTPAPPSAGIMRKIIRGILYSHPGLKRGWIAIEWDR